MAQPAKNTVTAFLDAMNAEDFNKARDYVDENMDFIGVMGTRHGADAYFTDMAKMKFKYDIEKAVADDADVMIWYKIRMGDKTIDTAGWYHLVDGKIRTFRALFDPRPLL
jgi:predicted ester cyclase